MRNPLDEGYVAFTPANFARLVREVDAMRRAMDEQAAVMAEQRRLLDRVAAAVADELLDAAMRVTANKREHEAREPIPAPPWMTDAREALPREWITGEVKPW